MSSVRVSWDQPPASPITHLRHMPAVPLKVKKRPERLRARLLPAEVAVQVHALHAGEKVVFPVDMAPAGLDEAHAFIREEMDGFLQKVRFRNEVWRPESAGIRPWPPWWPLPARRP